MPDDTNLTIDGHDAIVRYGALESTDELHALNLELGMVRHLAHCLRKRQAPLNGVIPELTLAEYYLGQLTITIAQARDDDVVALAHHMHGHITAIADVLTSDVSESSIKGRAAPLRPEHFAVAAARLMEASAAFVTLVEGHDMQ